MHAAKHVAINFPYFDHVFIFHASNSKQFYESSITSSKIKKTASVEAVVFDVEVVILYVSSVMPYYACDI